MRSFYAEREVKSVGNSMTFAHNLLGADECRMGITALCDNVGRRLRKRGMVCQTVQLGIRDPEFHNRSRQITLERPTNSTRTLIDLSMQLLLGHWPMGQAGAPGCRSRLPICCRKISRASSFRCLMPPRGYPKARPPA